MDEVVQEGMVVGPLYLCYMRRRIVYAEARHREMSDPRQTQGKARPQQVGEVSYCIAALANWATDLDTIVV